MFIFFFALVKKNVFFPLKGQKVAPANIKLGTFGENLHFEHMVRFTDLKGWTPSIAFQLCDATSKTTTSHCCIGAVVICLVCVCDAAGCSEAGIAQSGRAKSDLASGVFFRLM